MVREAVTGGDALLSPNGVADDVDAILSAENGQVQREPDARYCRHKKHEKCTHCLPIDPFDEAYLHSRDIKHMSFHAYVRKLTAGHGRGSHIRTPLENVVSHLKPGCADHRPYPAGICTKCRPPMLTLNRQRFRHVDNISFENDQLSNRFLDFWRRTSHQRIGYLLGRYETFLEVPLGIKAVVAAIYEPPQSSTSESVALDADPNEDVVDKLCIALDMKRVGWIFTDLWTADASKGTVHCTRHQDSFLLSAQECITAGWLQNKYPNVTKYCSDGYFGSKFVTVIASGDQSDHIKFTGYQVSNQCASLVAADVLISTNHPELAYVRKEPIHENQYIVDVQFIEKDKYGNEVTRDGRPLPVEYLLVDVPAGMPKEPLYTFHTMRVGKPFPVENRSCMGDIQSLDTLNEYVSQFSSNQFFELASDFHFLLYLATNDTIPFSMNDLQVLCNAIKARDRVAAFDWSQSNEQWSTLQLLASERGAAGGTTASASRTDASNRPAWACVHCTFENASTQVECSMCSLPRN